MWEHFFNTAAFRSKRWHAQLKSSETWRFRHFPTPPSRTGSSSAPSIRLHVWSLFTQVALVLEMAKSSLQVFSPQEYLHTQMFPTQKLEEKKWVWTFSVLDTWLCKAEDIAIYLQSEERHSNTGSSATLQAPPWQHLAVLDKQCSDSWLHQSCPSAGDVQHHPLRKLTAYKLGSHLQSEISACWLCS